MSFNTVNSNLKILSHFCRILSSYVLKSILAGASAGLGVGKLGIAAGSKTSCFHGRSC